MVDQPINGQSSPIRYEAPPPSFPKTKNYESPVGSQRVIKATEQDKAEEDDEFDRIIGKMAGLTPGEVP